ncbi:DUF6221 family protein [Amycolatopsis thailandensis]|uniref:DUF6221 family protein n=1 Tax=Amycolatopsis thailandensis TaxID=589330 RepID=UPI003669EEE3
MNLDELIAWLRRQIDDDEEIARAAGASRWRASSEETGDGHNVYFALSAEDEADSFASTYGAEADKAEHIVRHEPVRVLADVAAKRRILDEVVPKINAMDDKIEDEWGDGGEGPHDEAWLLARLLALPYADRPGYCEAWHL